MLRQYRLLKLSMLALLVVLMMAAPVSAQTPVTLGQTQIGEVSSAAPEVRYVFNAQAGQSVTVEVIAIAPGMATQVTILNANGALVQAIGNPTQTETLTGVVTFPQAGAYTISISSTNGVFGQFVLTVNSSTPTVPPTPLALDTPVQNTLQSGQSLIYSFSGDPNNPVRLSLSPVDSTVNVRAELRTAQGDVLGNISSGLLDATLTLPPVQGDFLLELINDVTEVPDLSYRLVLSAVTPEQAEQEAQASGAPPPNPLPALPTSGPCVLATSGGSVNVRSGPGTNYAPPLGTIGREGQYSVSGRSSDGGWYQIDYNGAPGWVAGSVTRRGGDCAALPTVAAPPLPSQGSSGTAATPESGGPASTPEAGGPASTPESGGPASTPEATPEMGGEMTPEATQEMGGEMTPEPTQEATPEAQQEDVQIAGNNDQTIQINIKGGQAQASGAVSYPQGDTIDTVTYRVVGFDSVTTSGNVTVTILCSGTAAGLAFANTSGGGGGGRSCGSAVVGTNFHTNDSDTGRVSISLTEGDNVFVGWTVILNASQ